MQPAIQEDVIAAIDLADASTLVVGATGGLGGTELASDAF